MKKLLIPVLFIGTMVMLVVMAKTGAPLQSAAVYKNIVCLEFAYTKEKATAVVNDWGITNVAVAKNNTYYDFIFLFFYALFLFFTCKKIAELTHSKPGSLIAKGALLAGFLDVLENTGMLITLSGNVSGIITLFTTIVSVIKWALAIAAVIYLLAGLVRLVITKKLHLLLA
jgi:hypothetical protein